MNLSRLAVVPPPKISPSVVTLAVDNEDDQTERFLFLGPDGGSFWASIIDVDDAPYLTDIFVLEEDTFPASGTWHRVPKERYFRPKRLQKARELAGLSIGQAARIACLESNLLASAENGNLSGLFSPGAAPSATVYTRARLALLAKVYGVSIEWLQGRDRPLDSAMQELLANLPITDREAITELLLMRDKQ